VIGQAERAYSGGSAPSADPEVSMTVTPDRDARAHQETSRQRRQLVARAIEQATASEWLGAIETNQRLIDASGQDVEAYNRLGKAYAQIGRIPAARAAYDAALLIDPANTIALRNAARWAAL